MMSEIRAWEWRIEMKKESFETNLPKYFYSMNLQLFTGDEGGNSSESAPEVITFNSQAELDSHLDKHASKALNTARVKWETEMVTKLEEAKTEAEKMAQMSADEKLAAKAQKQADELAKREADITTRELRAQSLEALAEKGLPKELIGAVVLSDADTCAKSIEAIETAFGQAVEKAVNEKLLQSADVPGSQNNQQAKSSEGETFATNKNEKEKANKTSLWG